MNPPGSQVSLPLWFVLFGAQVALAPPHAASFDSLRPVVDVEENVYAYEPANNGAGPMWCSGSTCLVRIGAKLFASGLETIKDCPPLNNCRWTLYTRDETGWHLLQTDQTDRTREPCPMAAFPGGSLFLSVNPTLVTNRQAGGGPAQPQLLQFTAPKPGAPFSRLLPVWAGEPKFTEHSYRSLAADGPGGELILFQNVGYTHAEWSFRDRNGNWSAQGQLAWPWGAAYERPQPIRVCYPNVALKGRAVYFCGVSDIQEPRSEWRQFKHQLTGNEWDYDFRRLFFTWNPDIRAQPFADWIEIASRDQTGGWISPGDLWVDSNEAVHLVWSERAIDERLRAKFFAEAKQSHAINYARVQDGKVALRRTLLEAREGEGGLVPSSPRFQVLPDQRLILFYLVRGRTPAGLEVAENRVVEIKKDGALGDWVKVPLKVPFSGPFTTTWRAGSSASTALELLGPGLDQGRTIRYARILLSGSGEAPVR
ncbi:MAG: hypothetical protein U1G07_09260 [Verrucomicrobiota bacterium]